MNKGKTSAGRTKDQMFLMILADAVGSTYALPGFKRARPQTLATIRAALDKARLLQDPAA